MTFKRTMAAFVLVPLLLCGCGRHAGWFDQRDRSTPLLERAELKASQGQIDDAIALYSQALDENPGLARAHLDLAILLHDQKEDYLRAAYHYQRYLEMRPDTEKAQMIQNRLRLASQSFAVKTLQERRRGPIGEPVADSKESALRLLDLEKENAALKMRLTVLEAQLGAATNAVTNAAAPTQVAAVSSRRPAGAPPSPDKTKPKNYRVARGDTLSSIAARCYGDAGKWRTIYDANSANLTADGRVREGQVLVIP